MAKASVIEPYPASPSRPPKYAIYAYWPPKEQLEEGQIRTTIILNFCEAFAAKRCVMAFMEESDNFTWIGENRIMGENEVEVYCPQGLDEIISYKFRGDEADWRMTPDREAQAQRIKRKTFIEEREPPEKDEDGNIIKPVKVRKERAEKTPKASRSGLIDMSQIASDLGYDAKDCRQALRKAKFAKPDVGWAFTENQVEEVKKVIKANIKIR